MEGRLADGSPHAKVAGQAPLLAADDPESLLQAPTRDRPQDGGIDEVIGRASGADHRGLMLQTDLPQEPKGFLEGFARLLVDLA